MFLLPAGGASSLHSSPTRRSSDLCRRLTWPSSPSTPNDGCASSTAQHRTLQRQREQTLAGAVDEAQPSFGVEGGRKSTRLNSSHLGISYAVVCLKKKSAWRDRPNT